MVKVIVPKVLEPSPSALDNRSEDRVKTIYGNGFGWFTEMQLEKGGTEGSGQLVTKQQLTDIMTAAIHFQRNSVNDLMVDELNVLSSRMSSRPMGWSRLGVDKMAHLRAYDWNGGDMLELVRQQKKELPKAAGAENDILSCEEILLSERNKNKALGKYMERMSHSVSSETKKYAWFNSHIWGL